jgi:hypothetical protein
MRANWRWIRAVVVTVVVGAGCGPGERRGSGSCGAGEMHCDGLVLQTCVGGELVDTTTCPQACSATLGCTLCVPGTGTCNGNAAHTCNDSGTGYVDTTCDPVQGMTCDPNAGGCAGACAPHQLGTSYIGCDYYPTVTGNTVGEMFDFAVAIANTASSDATVTIDGGALGAAQVVTVPANKVIVQVLPWHDALKLCSSQSTDGCSAFGTPLQAAALAHKGAYHVRSTVPVTLYQFNPLQYDKGGTFSYSNDASLLLPTNAWRGRYFAAAWQVLTGASYPSELAVTAMADNTTVMIQAKAGTTAGQGAPGFSQGVAQPVTLMAGDVIEITSVTGDLTGSLIDADHPVQVISGHYCADVPDGVFACDHIEESMFPVDTLGTHYVINAPAVTSIATGKVEVIRIIATAANTTVTYDPPQAGAGTTLAHAGDFIELSNNAASFSITSSDKVLVAQYMEGQDAGGGTGDPAMALAVPVEQFRTDYLFHAPTNYESNYVDVTAPMGALILLDGAPLAFTPIGTTGYGISRVTPLSAGPGNDGNHGIQGDQPFGITVYGYGQYTSYWYPGGLDLNSIIN